ncbi:MAG: Signal peptidase [Verrucomicrobiales bacterium]|jgi:signal peptidase I|nr:Signal peptidase [Verrucomicrobiales bacterium]
MTIPWFLSKSLREALEGYKHVKKLYLAQRDLISPQGQVEVTTALTQIHAKINSKTSDEEIQKEITSLGKVAEKWLKPYPHSEWRENIEVLLVAIAVAMAVRTFFLQPFKIPTGSMQPTLYGIEYEPFDDKPSALKRYWDACVHGEFYHQLLAEDDGVIVSIGKPEKASRFVNKLILTMGYTGPGGNYNKAHTIWFAPEDDQKFRAKAGLYENRRFKKGDKIFSMKEVTGDHLFVDRLTFNFRKPERGDVVVFQTRGIYHPSMPQDQFYIKRLVGLGGETLSIGNDHHTVVDGKRLDASTPHFEKVYTFESKFEENHYFGHVNQFAAEVVDPKYRMYQLAPNFPTESSTFTVPPRRYMVFGDNTMNSSDSRTWGTFPQENIIGKSFFVYWPISNHGESRFGWSHLATR